MIKPRSSSLAPCINVTVDNCSISPSPQVKSLGVIFDRMHSFQEHISNITGSSYFHLHNINRLCPSYVDYTLIVYFNSLLFGLALKSVHKFQDRRNVTNGKRSRDASTKVLDQHEQHNNTKDGSVSCLSKPYQ